MDRIFDSHVHFSCDKESIVKIATQLGIDTVANISYPAFGHDYASIAAYERELFEGWNELEGVTVCKVFSVPSSSLGFGYSKFVDEGCAIIDAKVKEGGYSGIKIWKDIGMKVRDCKNHPVRISDTRLTPLFQKICQHDLVCVIHAADPIVAWLESGQEVDYYKKNKEYYMFMKSDFPSHSDLIDDVEVLLSRWPTVKFIAAHLLNLEHDFNRLFQILNRYKNLYVDTSAKNKKIITENSIELAELVWSFPSRVLYGSDWTVRSKLIDRDECFGKYTQITSSLEQIIQDPMLCKMFFRENAEGLFLNDLVVSND